MGDPGYYEGGVGIFVLYILLFDIIGIYLPLVDLKEFIYLLKKGKYLPQGKGKFFRQRCGGLGNSGKRMNYFEQ